MAEAPAPECKSVAEEEGAMTQKIGERELELRRQREAQFGGKPAKAPAVPELPKTSGRKPVKKKSTVRRVKPRPGVARSAKAEEVN